jgi:ABC-type amino acid transport substrate-binding protein
MRRALVAGVLPATLIAAIAFAGLLAAGAPARGGATLPTKKQGVLTVAIRLGNPGFSEGTIANPHGFSVDASRAVAGKMGLKVRYVDYPFARLFVPEPKPYDVAFQFVTITPQRRRLVDFATFEITSSEGVLVAKDITGPVTLARLRTLQVCTKEVTTGDVYVRNVLQPKGLVLEYPDASEALRALSTSICDAFVFDLPALIAAKQETPDLYGAVAGRVGATEYYGPVLPKGSRLLPALNKAITSLRRAGVFKKLAVQHFGTQLASVPVIH